jgi:hypothetical protein
MTSLDEVGGSSHDDMQLQSSNRDHCTVTCSSLKPLVLSTLLVTLSLSTLKDELELHLFLALQTCLFLLSILEICFHKVFRINSTPYIQVLAPQLRIAWEIVF